MQSEQINELAAALSKAQGEFTAIPKGETNPFFKSKYAGLPDVIKVAAPILAGNGLAISQFITVDEFGSDSLKTYLMHSSGQFIEHSMKMHLGKLDSQGQGSATTYARRYSYMSVLGLVADEDDDGNRASHGQAQARQTRPQADSAPVQTGEVPEDINVIMKAAEQSGDEFLSSLAQQYMEKGRLSEKQIGAGVTKAMKILSAPRSMPEYDYAPEDERFA